MVKELLQQGIYWLPIPVLGILIVTLLRRKFASRLPFFFVYVAAGLLGDVARLLVYSVSHGITVTYYYVYWISQAINAVFAFLTAGELVLNRLFPKFYRVGFYRYLFAFAIVA